jgi:hypothetical protein
LLQVAFRWKRKTVFFWLFPLTCQLRRLPLPKGRGILVPDRVKTARGIYYTVSPKVTPLEKDYPRGSTLIFPSFVPNLTFILSD